MLLSKRVHASQPKKLADFLNGGEQVVFEGNNITTAIGITLTVPPAANGVPDFAGVQIGDRVHISGESSATVFLVDNVVSDQEIELDNPCTAIRAGNAHVRILRGGLTSPADAQLVIQDPQGGGWIVVFESDNFFVR